MDATSATRVACSIMAEKLGATELERTQYCSVRDLRDRRLFTSLESRSNGD
jgi:hypothetical protein